MLALQGALASEPAGARTRAEPAAGFANPAISPQALDNRPLQPGSMPPSQQSGIERDIAQLIERANSSRTNAAQANRRPSAKRIETSPIANAADAAWLLGLIYAHGAGIMQDTAQAQLWFERALSQGQNLAALGLAWCAVEGCKQAPNLGQARVRMASVRAQFPARAQYLEWWMLSKNTALPVSAATKTSSAPDDDAIYRLASRSLIEQAARLGDIHALIELGLEAIALGNKAQARQWFEQAAAAGSGAAAHNMRVLNQQEANNYPALNSHISMDATSLLAMAQRNHRGLGQPANYAEAIRLYRLAHTKGSKAAGDMMALIFSRPTASGQLDIAWMQHIASLNIHNPAIGLPNVGSPINSGTVFQRERSPLFDYLPALWKFRIHPIS